MTTRHSNVGREQIEYSFNLVFDDKGGMRLTRASGALARNERAMAVTCKLPMALFKTPSLRATIGVSETVPSDIKIDINAATEALKGALGVDIDLRVVTPEK